MPTSSLQKAINNMLPHLSEDAVKRVLALTLREFNTQFSGSGLEMKFTERKEDFPKELIVKAPAASKSKKGPKEIMVHGRMFKSLKAAAVAYGLNYSNIYQSLKRGRSVDDLFPKKESASASISIIKRTMNESSL